MAARTRDDAAAPSDRRDARESRQPPPCDEDDWPRMTDDQVRQFIENFKDVPEFQAIQAASRLADRMLFQRFNPDPEALLIALDPRIRARQDDLWSIPTVPILTLQIPGQPVSTCLSGRFAPVWRGPYFFRVPVIMAIIQSRTDPQITPRFCEYVVLMDISSKFMSDWIVAGTTTAPVTLGCLRKRHFPNCPEHTLDNDGMTVRRQDGHWVSLAMCNPLCLLSPYTLDKRDAFPTSVAADPQDTWSIAKQIIKVFLADPRSDTQPIVMRNHGTLQKAITFPTGFNRIKRMLWLLRDFIVESGGPAPNASGTDAHPAAADSSIPAAADSSIPAAADSSIPAAADSSIPAAADGSIPVTAADTGVSSVLVPAGAADMIMQPSPIYFKDLPDTFLLDEAMVARDPRLAQIFINQLDLREPLMRVDNVNNTNERRLAVFLHMLATIFQRERRSPNDMHAVIPAIHQDDPLLDKARWDTAVSHRTKMYKSQLFFLLTFEVGSDTVDVWVSYDSLDTTRNVICAMQESTITPTTAEAVYRNDKTAIARADRAHHALLRQRASRYHQVLYLRDQMDVDALADIDLFDEAVATTANIQAQLANARRRPRNYDICRTFTGLHSDEQRVAERNAFIATRTQFYST